jgi:hypothetical protein
MPEEQAPERLTSDVSSAKTMSANREIVRVLILSLMAVFWTINPAHAQDRHQSKKDHDLYWMALAASVKETEKQWGNLNVVAAHIATSSG